LIKEEAVSGASCARLYKMAVDVAKKYGLSEHFMGYPEPVAFTGHGLGIELDELPVLARGYDRPLEEKMVFALEPKFVFPEGAVGIENTYRVTPKGLETLTEFDESIGYLKHLRREIHDEDWNYHLFQLHRGTGLRIGSLLG